jgi:DNA-binding MarR family transcriptional regulator
MPLEDLAPELYEFVDRYIDQFASWDVLVYFHENPDAERRVSDLAVEIGRRASLIQPVLEGFRDAGILREEANEADEPSYRYSAPADFRQKMSAFIEATRDRTNRLAIVSKVLQKEARRL